MNDTLKVAGRIGAELGAAKAENDRLREALQAMLEECDPMRLNCGEPWCRARDALLPKSEPCGGCGNSDESKRCIGCAHPFTPVPTDTYTAVDMATAAAQGFRDGQAAVEQAAAQDERKTFEVEIPDISAIYDGRSFIPYRSLEAGERLMTVAQHLRIEKQLRTAVTRLAQTEQQPVKYTIGDLTYARVFKAAGLTNLSDIQAVLDAVEAAIAQLAPQQEQSRPANKLRALAEIWDQNADEADEFGNAQAAEALRLAAFELRATLSAPQGKFRMGDLVKKSTGSEWEGRVVGWYSTEQTKEGYAVESSAHRNSVQIYPVTALEAVE